MPAGGIQPVLIYHRFWGGRERTVSCFSGNHRLCRGYLHTTTGVKPDCDCDCHEGDLLVGGQLRRSHRFQRAF